MKFEADLRSYDLMGWLKLHLDLPCLNCFAKDELKTVGVRDITSSHPFLIKLISLT